MKRSEVISELKGYFKTSDLVCPHTFKRFGESSWNFFDTDTLATVLILRTKILNVPMICNDMMHTQRGNRCNLCAMVKAKTSNYLSAHILFRAFDFALKDMTAETARKLISANANLLPCNVRLESNVTWLHIDTNAHDKSNKVTIF